MQVWNVLCAARGKYSRQKWCKKSAHHRTTLSGYIFATKAFIDNLEKMLNSSMSSTCPHNMVNFGPLVAEICWWLWGTPTNFNGFRSRFRFVTAPTSLNGGQPNFATLHDVWPSPGLLHCIYTFGGSCPLTEFRQVQNSLCVQVLRSCTLCSKKLYHQTHGGIEDLEHVLAPLKLWGLTHSFAARGRWKFGANQTPQLKTLITT